MNNQFEILIREKSDIKSRQWWKKEILKGLSYISKTLPKKTVNSSKKCSFTLLITGDKEIQNLNKEFRKKNKATDVLSFHLRKDLQIKNNYLGDIVISSNTAIKQAKGKKIPIENELILLFIHGYLHLLGYDHIKKKDAKVMFKFQNGIMKELIY
jgi:probable rRNA maturation factor